MRFLSGLACLFAVTLMALPSHADQDVLLQNGTPDLDAYTLLKNPNQDVLRWNGTPDQCNVLSSLFTEFRTRGIEVSLVRTEDSSGPFALQEAYYQGLQCGKVSGNWWNGIFPMAAELHIGETPCASSGQDPLIYFQTMIPGALLNVAKDAMTLMGLRYVGISYFNRPSGNLYNYQLIAMLPQCE